MSESIGKSPSRPLTPPLKGTQPLKQGAAQPTAPQKSLLERMALLDQMSGLSGTGKLEAFASDPLSELRAQAQQLMVGLDPSLRAQGERILEMLSKPEGTLEEFRSHLSQMLAKFKQLVESKRDEQRAIRAEADIQWQIFYQSLERYLTNLKTLETIEANVLDRNLKEQKSLAKYAERLLTAAVAQAPEHRFSLLSATLGQKP